MVIFLGNTNSGDQNFLNPFIYHRDTSHYMVLKKIGVTSSGPFALILTNTLVNNINILNANLYLFYSESDANQHILDTLEQCISVIIEKLHRLDQDKNGSRLSSMEYSEPVKGKVIFRT